MLGRMPGTDWKEVIGPDEEARFTRYGDQLVAGASGRGRALHKKQHLGLRATVEVPALTGPIASGLFAQPGTHDALIRLSNGSPAMQPDRKPDIRGFALRITADGDGALGGKTTAQCFVMINTPTFAFPDVDQFMAVALAAPRGPIAILRALMKTHGFFGAFKHARALDKGIKKPFAGFARETFHTAAPIAWGAYAAKVRIVPVDAPDAPAPNDRDWSEDVKARLANGLRWDLQAQLYEDEATTPIEDPRVEWTTPVATVARVTAPPQDPAAIADEVERASFDPWAALAAHRPLGEIMRARKVAYYASQRARAG